MTSVGSIPAINEVEAREILDALALRARQDGIQAETTTAVENLGRRLSKTFEQQFGWKQKAVFDHNLKRISKVRVR